MRRSSECGRRDALTKSLPRRVLAIHRQWRLVGMLLEQFTQEIDAVCVAQYSPVLPGLDPRGPVGA
jgi:hypothetical protein